MIRDPSDGSVREKPETGIPASKPRKPEESGLPPVQDPGSIKEAERLQRAREWLKEYRKAVDDTNRMNDKGEVT